MLFFPELVLVGLLTGLDVDGPLVFCPVVVVGGFGACLDAAGAAGGRLVAACWWLAPGSVRISALAFSARSPVSLPSSVSSVSSEICKSLV